MPRDERMTLRGLGLDPQRLVELDRVVVRELLAGPDVAHRDDPHPVAERDRLRQRDCIQQLELLVECYPH